MRAAATVLALALAVVSHDASAQCEAKRSECSACHDGARGPSPGSGAWHRDHAFADLCAVCHGGMPDARDPAGAHAGMSPPLEDVSGRCGSCHGAASTGLATRYAATDAGPPAATAPGTTQCPSEPHGRKLPNVVAGLLALGLALGGGGFVASRERRARSRRSP